MIDPRVEAAIAAGRVPEDISAEHLSETRDQPAIVGILFVTALTTFVVVARLLSRAYIVQRFGLDDGVALISLPCLVAFVGLCIELINLGSGRHYEYIRYVLDVETVMHTQILDFVAHILYTTALLLCRISGLAFYYRVCNLHKKFLVAIKVVFGILALGYIAQMLLLIFHCHPLTGLWPYGWEPDADNYTCLQWGLVYSVNSSVSLICDILLFGIPVAMLWILEMPRKRKAQLAGILLPGVAVIAISIARLVLVILGQWEADMSWSYNQMLTVEVSEVGATLIALSAPGLKILFDKITSRKDRPGQSSGSNYHRKRGSNTMSKDVPLSTLRLRSHQSLSSNLDNATDYGASVCASARNNSKQTNTGGIMVRVDFDVNDGSSMSKQDVDQTV